MCRRDTTGRKDGVKKGQQVFTGGNKCQRVLKESQKCRPASWPRGGQGHSEFPHPASFQKDSGSPELPETPPAQRPGLWRGRPVYSASDAHSKMRDRVRFVCSMQYGDRLHSDASLHCCGEERSYGLGSERMHGFEIFVFLFRRGFSWVGGAVSRLS